MDDDDILGELGEVVASIASDAGRVEPFGIVQSVDFILGRDADDKPTAVFTVVVSAGEQGDPEFEQLRRIEREITSRIDGVRPGMLTLVDFALAGEESEDEES